jgi:STE24 endopeptidase
MERWIFGAAIALVLLEAAVELLLNELNLSYAHRRRAQGAVPKVFAGAIAAAEYRRSLDYALARGRFARWSLLYGTAWTLVVLASGLLPWLDAIARRAAPAAIPYAEGVLFCLALAFLGALVSLPPDLYRTFVLEERFGFNRTTPSLYAADRLKGSILALSLGAPFLWAVLFLMDRTGPLWWLYAFAFILGFELALVVVYPSWIAPWFNRFEPLGEGELRRRIEEVAAREGFATSGVYTVDGSRRSAHSNAYFAGLGRSRRIVLFDTLLRQMGPDEIVAVLAHEIGHYRLRHLPKRLALEACFLLIGLCTLGFLLDYEPFFAAFRLAPSHHAALALFALLSGPATFYLAAILNRVSRAHEYEADRYAAKALADARPMEEALLRLAIENLSDLSPHPWYSAYHDSHPPPAERLAALRRLRTPEAAPPDARG